MAPGKTLPSEPRYFESPEALRQWFRGHAASASELIAGFMKVGSGQPSITWPQAVDEALCVGWIDGVRHRIDDERYRIRFTPRKPGSHWSGINIERVAALQAAGRMTPAGLAAFALRTESRSRAASYEQAEMPVLTAAENRLIKKSAAAWTFYESSPAAYKKRVVWWIVRAKQAETRARRLARLIEACAQQQRL